MAVQEVTFVIDWFIFISVIVAVFSLLLSFWQVRKQIGKESLNKLNARVDNAMTSLKDSQDYVKHLQHENDALRREKFALLEQIARMSRDVLDVQVKDNHGPG